MKRIKIAETEEDFKKLEEISKKFEEEILLETQGTNVSLEKMECIFTLALSVSAEVRLPKSVEFKAIKIKKDSGASITTVDESYIIGILSSGNEFIIHDFFK